MSSDVDVEIGDNFVPHTVEKDHAACGIDDRDVLAAHPLAWTAVGIEADDGEVRRIDRRTHAERHASPHRHQRAQQLGNLEQGQTGSGS